MDFTKFSDDNFDLKSWINAAFESQKDTHQNREQFVATLITKLQVYIQEINNSIDETSSQTVQNFPRILREIEVLKQEAFMLKEQMKNLRDDLVKVEKNTVNESMKLLLDLDIMRTNMMKIQFGLQEADNWSTLTSDLETILQSNDLPKITSHIESMQNSLQVLLQNEDSMDYLNRVSLLEDFKNKFEAKLSSDIIASFNSKSIELSRNYVHIFERIHRLEELKKYYYQCERAKLLEKLSEFNREALASLKSNASNSFNLNGEIIKLFLKNCLDFLNETWHNEVSWCKQIFTDSHSIVVNLLIKFFDEFSQHFLKLINDYLLNNNQNDLEIYFDYLTQFKLEIDQFTFSLNSSLETVQVSKEMIIKLFENIYFTFRVNLKQYSSHLTTYFGKLLEKQMRMSGADLVENVQLLSNSVQTCFNVLDKEFERCQTLTNNCCFVMFVDSLKHFLKQFMDDFKRVVSNMKERKLKSAENLNEESENWILFRSFVRIIQILGDLIAKYESLEEHIDKSILDTFVHEAKSGQSHQLAIAYFKDFYLLDETDRTKLNNLINYIESGDNYNLMKDLNSILNNLSESVHKHAFDIVFSTIKTWLKNLAKQSIWPANQASKNEDLSGNQSAIPLFALVPQEYITKIGQYLLTLPQNFESFTMQDNTSLIIALRRGKLPYLDEKDLCDDLMTCWLDSIANATYVTLCDEIFKFDKLALNSQRQLIIDIEFICSVFEDVGLKDYSNLLGVLELLKANGKDEFEEKLKGKAARLVSFARRVKSF